MPMPGRGLRSPRCPSQTDLKLLAAAELQMRAAEPGPGSSTPHSVPNGYCLNASPTPAPKQR